MFWLILQFYSNLFFHLLLSNISKLEDTLQEYKLYRDFLFKLSPPDWQEKQSAKKKSKKTKPISAINREHAGKSRETDRVKRTQQSDRCKFSPSIHKLSQINFNILFLFLKIEEQKMIYKVIKSFNANRSALSVCHY